MIATWGRDLCLAMVVRGLEPLDNETFMFLASGELYKHE